MSIRSSIIALAGNYPIDEYPLTKKTNMYKENVNSQEVEELACYITGLDYDIVDGDADIISAVLIDQYGIDLYNFIDLIKKLTPLINYIENRAIGKIIKGFGDNEKKLWLVNVVEKIPPHL